MKRYRNLSGHSGVVAYDTGSESIDVMFVDGVVYRYTYQSASPLHVETMKKLALAGRGLSAYVTRHVREAYASKRSKD